MQKLKEKQEKEFDKTFWNNFDGLRTFYINDNNHKFYRQAKAKDVKKFLDNIRQETAKYERERIYKEQYSWLSINKFDSKIGKIIREFLNNFYKLK